MPDAVAKLTLEQARALLEADDSPYATHPVSIAGVVFRVFRHAPRNLAALYAGSERHDGRVMLVYEEERYRVEDVRRHSRNLAHHLVHELGVRKGDRIALAMRNYPEWCFAYAAATSIGAVIVPLNAWWTGPELRYGLIDSGAKLLIADDERCERLRDQLGELGVTALVARPSGALPPGARPIAPLLQGDFALPAVDVQPDDDATILYTSGSTGSPKGVVSTHRAVVNAVFTWEVLVLARLMTELPEQALARVERWLHGGAEALKSSPLQLPQSAMLITLPLFHVTGCNVQFLPAFRSGRKMVMMYRWDPERALELIEREKVTDFSGVPTMSWELVNSPDFARRDTSSLRSLSAGGAARPPAQVKRLHEQGGGALPSAGYGMTETGSLGTAIGGDDYLLRPASAGRALPPLVEIRIVDGAGRVLGPDQEGEVCLKCVANMRGYWNKPEDTVRTLRDGWVHSGDLGKLDQEGFLYITGRAKDLVIRGGENISCPEVEHALYTHPLVFEAAVYPVPDERLGEAVAATVRVRPGAQLSKRELQAHLAHHLARFKLPTHLWLQAEELPRIASGKIDKLTLKQTAVGKLTRDN